VHTGVHYPGDTVTGSLIGASAGLAVADLLDRRSTRLTSKDESARSNHR
jgi:membrane-associated phospholipid phosphatase